MEVIDVDTLQAGPELDALIAERVMGWDQTPVEWLYGTEAPPLKYRTPEGYLVSKHGLPPYSTDIAAAWQVIEKLNWGVHISSPMGNPVLALPDDPALRGKYSCYLTKVMPGVAARDSSVIATADTLSLAICRAALKAILKHSKK